MPFDYNCSNSQSQDLYISFLKNNLVPSRAEEKFWELFMKHDLYFCEMGPKYSPFIYNLIMI